MEKYVNQKSEICTDLNSVPNSTPSQNTVAKPAGTSTFPVMRVFRIIVDAAMYVLFLLLMGYHLFENRHHEILGAAVFILFFIHNGLNWRWYKNLFKGKYTLSRSLQTACNLLLCVTMLCTIAAALMLSRDVFYFLNFTNSNVGRKIHMVATVWTFLLESLHLGFHWQAIQKSIIKKITLPAPLATTTKWLFRAVLLAVCLYGIFAFRSRNLCNEMFLLTEFKFMDFEEPPLYFFADHAAISILVVTAGFYLKKLAVSAGRGRSNRNKTTGRK